MSEQNPEKVSEAGFFCPAFVGVRCLLLFAVLEGHYWFEATSDVRVHPLTFAVPCFFVLSGYLISHTLFCYEDRPWKETFPAFYLRRALRIFPPFYAVLCLAHLVHGLPYLGWQASYLMNLKIFLLSAFEPAAFYEYIKAGDYSAIHFWSVDVEEQFYLLYPLFVAATYRGYRSAWLLAGILLSIATRAYCRQEYHYAFYGGLTPVAGEYILWGCLMAWQDRLGRLTWLRNSLTLYASSALFLALVLQDKSYGRFAQWKPYHTQTLYAILLALMIFALRHSPTSWAARILSWRPLGWIGRMSYGAYLVHAFLNPIVDALVRALPWLAPFPVCPRAVAGPLVTLVGAALLWYGLEQPIEGWRRSLRPRSS